MLNWISANQIDAPIGKAVYTQWLNDRGGIESDLTVTRLDDDRFMVVTAAAAATRDMALLRRACRDRDVTVTDVTDDLPMLGLMGPGSRDVLAQLQQIDNLLYASGDPKGGRLLVGAIRTNLLRMWAEV